MPGEGDVVFFKNRAARLCGGEADDPRHDVLARLIRGMRLARKENLHRSLGVAEQLRQARPVPQQQVRALVGSEPAAESDRQRVHIDLMRRLGALLRKLEQPSLEVAMDRPQLRRRYL